MQIKADFQSFITALREETTNTKHTHNDFLQMKKAIWEKYISKLSILSISSCASIMNVALGPRIDFKI